MPHGMSLSKSTKAATVLLSFMLVWERNSGTSAYKALVFFHLLTLKGINSGLSSARGKVKFLDWRGQPSGDGLPYHCAKDEGIAHGYQTYVTVLFIGRARKGTFSPIFLTTSLEPTLIRMFVNRIARSTLAHQSRMFHMRPAHRLPVHSFGLPQPQATRIIQPIRSRKYSSICERSNYYSQKLSPLARFIGLYVVGWADRSTTVGLPPRSLLFLFR
ncbi:hypothetical protein B9Z19DRAFT_1060916 [Tuber borchii]|uniref:Secreted protein n=1 Tax=Tuber borchii TaxID=42251 RepID=A0A2T7A7B8_TUBBO|nr:hypothetical protein B9Z19DRAFT_1060916 [Tuber borchii]